VESARAVLVADPDVESGKRTAAAIAQWGLHPLLVHDGVEAILAIQRNLPAVAVIDAALPKMFGFQVCEMVKRNESLRSIQVVLVGAIHHADRYRRPPSDIYGADEYLEQPDVPNGLGPILARLGLIDGDPAAQAVPDSIPPPPPEPVAVAPSPERVSPPAAANDSESLEFAKAERLARIIVSDIVLYHPDKFEAAVQAGNVAQALEPDLAEGRALFDQRVEASVRDKRDFLIEELERVAAERSR
jgi:CheY-like chemotaxis protein